MKINNFSRIGFNNRYYRYKSGNTTSYYRESAWIMKNVKL